MPEEARQEQPQKPENNPGGTPESNGGSTLDDLAVIKAELDEERKARAAIEQALADKDKRIAELQASVSVVQQAGDTAMAELSQLREAQAKAVAKYLEASRALNSSIPPDVIAGTTIDEIDASVAKALSIATAVKANLEAQAKEAKVPAGAPPRAAINLEGLSPREKIAAGIQQKGGT